MRFFACFVKWNNERFVLCSPPLRVHRRLQADVQTIQRQTKKDRTRRSPHKVIHAVYGFPRRVSITIPARVLLFLRDLQISYPDSGWRDYQ